MMKRRNGSNKTRILPALLLILALLIVICGCGGGGGSSSSSTPTTTTSTTGTVTGTVSLPANTNAKLFDVKVPLYARLFANPAHAAALTDLTTLTVKIGSATTNPSASGAYTLSATAGSNLDLTVTAPSGNVVLEAIIPTVTAGAATSQNVDSTSTAVALIYKQNTSLSISQISSSSAVTNVKTAIETALTDSTVDSVASNSTVTSAVTAAATSVAINVTIPSAPTGVTATAGDGQVTISWSSATGATSYNLYMASQSGVTKSNYSTKTGGMAHTGVTSPYTHTSLTNGTTYYFVVTAVNSAGESSESSEVSSTPVAGSSTKTALKVSAGSTHTCAVISDGTVRCWGANETGQLGNGTNTDSTTPVTVTGISSAKDVAAGARFTCALLADGSVKCWGSNEKSQLGDYTFTNSNVPVSVKDISNATKLTAGFTHVCAILNDKTVKCWGADEFGQLGDGNIIYSSSGRVVSVSGLTSVKDIAAGWYHTCASSSDGFTRCWGYNGWAQLGTGSKVGPDTCTYTSGSSSTTFSCSKTPTQVTGIVNVISIAAATYHTCAVLIDNSIKCWGGNVHGQLGNGESGSANFSAIPASVPDINNALSVSTFSEHTCAMLTDKTIKCWGYNEGGQLGNGTKTDSPTPVTVSGVGDAIAITSGDFHTCSLAVNGTLKCWGYNASGQLGTTSNNSCTVGANASPLPCSLAAVSVSSTLYVQSLPLRFFLLARTFIYNLLARG